LQRGIRNPQLSGKLGQWYFLHGRSGSHPRDLVGDDSGPGNFVLYSSPDGIHWDEGIVLMSRLQTPGGGDCYSANEIIGKWVRQLPIESLEELGEALFDFRSLQDLQAWLDAHDEFVR
jgi:hypothetical protein